MSAAAAPVFISYARGDSHGVDRLVDDLRTAGHACWIDRAELHGGDPWEQRLTQALESAAAVVVAVTARARDSRWVRRECGYADDIGKTIIPVRLEPCALPIRLYDFQAIDLFEDHEHGMQALLASLERLALAAAEPGHDHRNPVARAAAALLGSVTGRAHPPDDPLLAYRRHLRLEIAEHADIYTALAGRGSIGAGAERGAQGLDMRPEFALLGGRLREQSGAPRVFADIAEALAEVGRTVLIGEPGSGKTTTLMKVAHAALAAHEADARRPLPVFARLSHWSESGAPLAEFLAARLGIDSDALGKLLAGGRALLLLDGLNEIPALLRLRRAVELRKLLEVHARVHALLSCRELDYRNDPSLDLGLATLAVQPLDVARIRAFLEAHLAHLAEEAEDAAERRRLGRERADDLLWQLAGGERARELFRVWQAAGADQRQFFEAGEVPRENPDVYSRTHADDDRYWREVVRSPRSLLHLARSPYVLALFARVYDPVRCTLPDNRAALFEDFVRVLLAREGLGEDATGEAVATRAALLAGLERLAYDMQSPREVGGDATTILVRERAEQKLATPELMERAAGTGLIDVGANVRFAHQLLQEHFAARALAGRIAELPAGRLWPRERWWEPSGWEEVAVLLAGLQPPGCEAVVRWLADASPHTAARCLAESGARVPAGLAEDLRTRWTARMTDAEREPAAAARASLGRALAVRLAPAAAPRTALRGGPAPAPAMLDTRPGVGVRRAREGAEVPDLAWVDVPGGIVTLDDDAGCFDVSPFRVARFPVTNAQFDAFVADAEGHGEARWWPGIEHLRDGPRTPRWSEGNHPRETVSWHEALAFCRWLTARLHEIGELDAHLCVRLPTEWEWQQAASGGEPGCEYPWGAAFDAARCNTGESGIDRTTAVGIYPHGGWPGGPLDMAGNVWEWCLNRSDEPRATGVSTVDGLRAPRALRGGSWGAAAEFARFGYRSRLDPDSRRDFIGFRVCCSSPVG